MKGEEKREGPMDFGSLSETEKASLTWDEADSYVPRTSANLFKVRHWERLKARAKMMPAEAVATALRV